jgi:hypothetical protein
MKLITQQFWRAPPAPLEDNLAPKGTDYVHPGEVVQDDRLDPTEKRAILSAWASDACAVESKPQFRWLSGTPGPILVDHVLAALRSLDEMTGTQVRGTKAPMPRHAMDMRHLFAQRSGIGVRRTGR